MYCAVIYYNEKAKAYGGAEYTYRTELPLKPMTKVFAPVGVENEKKKALVVRTNIPESDVKAAWRDRLKVITELDNAKGEMIG